MPALRRVGMHGTSPHVAGVGHGVQRGLIALSVPQTQNAVAVHADAALAVGQADASGIEIDQYRDASEAPVHYGAGVERAGPVQPVLASGHVDDRLHRHPVAPAGG